MRLGLMGGTFDPVHRGHQRVAAAALECGLDRVLLVPTRRPPHKEARDISDSYHRFAMAALATAGRDRIGVSAWEVTRDAPSYTIDTVRHFSSAGHEVILIVGTDSLAELETWRDARALIEESGVAAYPRRPLTPDRLEEALPGWIRQKISAEATAGRGRVTMLKGEPDDTSATGIRGMIRGSRPVTGLLDPAVEEYILKQGLYRDDAH